MNLIWATRGRTWGHRFLLDGNYTDPLVIYDEVFASLGDEWEVCTRVDERVALRFPDPLKRTDLSGRIIIQEFVIFAPLAEQVATVADGIQRVWERPGIADHYADIYDLSDPS